MAVATDQGKKRQRVRKGTAPERSATRIMEDLHRNPPPSDIDTERAVLGILLMANNDLPWNRVLEVVYRHLSPRDFWVYPHAMLFASMKRAWNKRAPRVESIWFWYWLERDGVVKQWTDGHSRTGELMAVLAECIICWKWEGHLGYYCQKLRHLQIERENRNISVSLAIQAHATLPDIRITTVAQSIDWCKSAIREANKTIRLADTIRPMREEIDKQVDLLLATRK